MCLTIPINYWTASVIWQKGWGVEDTSIVDADFTIGDITFTGSADDPTPLQMKWQFRDTWRLRGVASRGDLRPAVEIEYFDAALEATGKVDDKDVAASKRYRSTLWSVGGCCAVEYPGMECAVTALFGDKAKSVEASASYRLARNLHASGGLRWKRIEVDDLLLRSVSVFGGFGVAW